MSPTPDRSSQSSAPVPSSRISPADAGRSDTKGGWLAWLPWRRQRQQDLEELEALVAHWERQDRLEAERARVYADRLVNPRHWERRRPSRSTQDEPAEGAESSTKALSADPARSRSVPKPKARGAATKSKTTTTKTTQTTTKAKPKTGSRSAHRARSKPDSAVA